MKDTKDTSKIVNHIIDNNTEYEFTCTKCGTKYIASQMPTREILKRIGYTMKCPICHTEVSILDSTEEES